MSSSGSSSAPGTTSRPSSHAGAEEFVAARTFWALARKEPPADPYPHLTDADLLVVAPLTANTMARLAHGLADDLLTETALAHRGALVLAPAMNTAMWEHPATQANLALLVERGAIVVGPDDGELAEGLVGPGRMAEPEEIAARIEALLSGGETNGRLAGRRVLVTAGGTREPLDAVRFLGNRSSGRMGVALAEAARKRGADVTLLAANLTIVLPAGVDVVETPTAADLRREALARADADIVLMAAAVADYRPAEPIEGKRPKDAEPWTVSLVPTADVARALGAARRDGQVLVAFGAEQGEDGLARKRGMLTDKNVDLVVYNDVGRDDIGFDSPDNEVVLVTQDGERSVGEGVQAGDRRRDPRRGRTAPRGGDVTAASEPLPTAEAGGAAALAERVVANLGSAIHASPETLRLPLLCLLAEGHVLVEDVPGVGKTVLAKALARSLELTFHRVQFTPDLLPADVTGVNVFDRQSGAFRFRAGPVFANVLLVDEINRASPKTQSALLEAMQETQVTVDGTTHVLERPFLVIATQNPVEYEGTFPLPEAQLDRFAVRMTIGYPPHADEARMLAEQTTSPPLDHLGPVAGHAELLAAIDAARQVHVEESVTRYVVALLRHTRASSRLALGGSPRSGIALLSLAKARALVEGRGFVVPEDVQALAVTVLAHRLILAPEARATGVTAEEIVVDALDETAVPV